MDRTIRIGTRDSQLALWQAKHVQQKLSQLNVSSELVPVKSTGDLILDKPLYELGITGIFTKTLDIAMLNGTVDIAVHSMKDVPTALPHGIIEGAVLERASVQDILLHKGLDFLDAETGIVATGSLRRKAQWLHRYPQHTITDLRGNVNTRLQKLQDHNWNGAIFAAAGLERIEIKPENTLNLSWMIPAPAQGVMLVVAKEQDSDILEALKELNHEPTAIAVHLERAFLKYLEGGCTAPIGALTEIEDNKVHFTGGLFALDGSQKITIKEIASLINIDPETLGKSFANSILERGGSELMQQIKMALR